MASEKSTSLASTLEAPNLRLAPSRSIGCLSRPGVLESWSEGTGDTVRTVPVCCRLSSELLIPLSLWVVLQGKEKADADLHSGNIVR